MQIIAENERGYVALDGNELIVGSKIVDPPKVRVTSPCDQTGGGGGDATNPSAPKPVFDLWWMMQSLAALGKVYPASAGT